MRRINPTDFTPEVLSPYDPRHVPLVPPNASVDEPPLIRVCINSQWVSHVDGLLERLLFRDAWQGTDAVIDNAIQQVTVLLKMLGAAASEGCEVDLLFDIRAEGCILQKSEDGGETWQNIIDLTSCVGITCVEIETLEPGSEATAEIVDGCLMLGVPRGDTGATGATGEQGEQGEQGETGQSGTTSNPAPDPVGTEGEPRRCAVARGVTEWLFGKFNDSLDFVQALKELEIEATTIAAQLIDAVPVVGAFVEAAVTFVNMAVSVEIALLKACDTEDLRDDVFCELYCLLPNDGIITDEIFNDWVEAVETIGTCDAGAVTIGEGLRNLMLGIGAQNFRNRGYIFSTGSEECPDCDDCPLPITLTPAFGGIVNKEHVDYNEEFTLTLGADSGLWWNWNGVVQISPCVKTVIVSVSNFTPGGTPLQANWAYRDCDNTQHAQHGSITLPSTAIKECGGNSLTQAVITMKCVP